MKKRLDNIRDWALGFAKAHPIRTSYCDTRRFLANAAEDVSAGSLSFDACGPLENLQMLEFTRRACPKRTDAESVYCNLQQAARRARRGETVALQIGGLCLTASPGPEKWPGCHRVEWEEEHAA